jgi:hypothetical protein
VSLRRWRAISKSEWSLFLGGSILDLRGGSGEIGVGLDWNELTVEK